VIKKQDLENTCPEVYEKGVLMGISGSRYRPPILLELEQTGTQEVALVCLGEYDYDSLMKA